MVQPLVEVLAAELGEAPRRARLLPLASAEAAHALDAAGVGEQVLRLDAALVDEASDVALLHLVLLGILSEAVVVLCGRGRGVGDAGRWTAEEHLKRQSPGNGKRCHCVGNSGCQWNIIGCRYVGMPVIVTFVDMKRTCGRAADLSE